MITPVVLLTARDETFAVDVGAVQPELRFDAPEAAFSEIASFAELLASLPKPILAFCRSGTRSGKLYRAATGG